MKLAPIPQNEEQRLLALYKLKILDTAAESRFNKITKEAIKKFNVPISTISIIDTEREWYKSSCGVQKTEAPRDTSFCGHTLLNESVLVIEDTLKDERFKNNPQVINSPKIRFYAGVALREKNSGLPVAVLCIKDIKPKTFSVDEVSHLLQLAKTAENELNK